jgi:hypothetical protein
MGAKKRKWERSSKIEFAIRWLISVQSSKFKLNPLRLGGKFRVKSPDWESSNEELKN